MQTLIIFAALLHMGWCQEVQEPFRLPDICTEMGPDQGTCGDFNIRFFFSPNDGECKEFMYSGCGGNQNRFETKERCESMCRGQDPVNTDEQTGNGVAVATDDSDSTGSVEIGDIEPTSDNNEEEGDGLNDGEEDDLLINKYLSAQTAGQMDIADNEMLKEAMAAYDVSVLEPESDETEDMSDHDMETEDSEMTSMDQQQETSPVHEEQEEHEDEHQETEDVEEETELEEEDDGLNDGNEDDALIHDYLKTDGHMSIEDNEMLKEVMASYEVSAIKPSEGSSDETADEEPQEGIEHEETSLEQIHEDTDAESENQQEALNDDDDDDGYLEDNGRDIDSFIEHLGGEATAEDRETLLEGIAELGATGMVALEDLTDQMERVPMQGDAEFPSETETDIQEAQTELGEATDLIREVQGSMEGDQGEVQESTGAYDNSDNDDEPEGINLDVDYPALSGIIDPEDQQALTEAMSVFDVVEAVTDGRKLTEEIVAELPVGGGKMVEVNVEAEAKKAEESSVQDEESGFVDMGDIPDADDDEDERDPIDEIMQEEKDAIFKPEKADPEDRYMLSELASQYDVAVMEEKEKEQEETQIHEDRYEPDENRLADNNDLPPRCTLPPETGPCRARKLKWFFDMKSGKCNTFVYGGCQGNSNSFRSKRKCMRSCIGFDPSRFGRRGAQKKTRTPVDPTQSPTKKITFMMPFMNMFKGAPSKTEFPPIPPITMDFPPPIRNIREQLSSTLTKISKKFGGPPIPMEKPSEPQSPFSPLRFLIMRALARPNKMGINRVPPPTPTPPPRRLPFSPRIRIMLPRPLPAQMPMIQTQQPIPNLLQPSRPMEKPTRPMAMPSRSRGPQRLSGGGFDMENPEHRDGPSVFSPRIKKIKAVESSHHDNRHTNNVSPNNKFTLLQVFVNKPHGPQSLSAMRQRQQPPPSPMKGPKSHTMQRKPFNHAVRQAAKSNPHPQPYPVFYPMMTPPHVHHGMRPMPPFWQPPMPHSHYHHQQAPNSPPHSRPQFRPPPMQHASNSPPHSHSQFRPPPMPVNLPQMPFNPPRMTQERRPEPERPIVIVTEEEEGEEEEEKSPYLCLQPLAPGRCKSYQTKWYYNTDSNKCEIFYFTGCGGNGNRFETWEECAATCIDQPEGPRTTMPSQPSTTEKDEVDQRPETIIFTSTMLPETAEEAEKAAEEAQAGAEESKSAEELRTTTEAAPVQQVKDHTKEASEHVDEVVTATEHVTTEYIILLAVMATVAMAVIVLVILSIAHLCRKAQTSKKEKALEAVINHHIYGDLPNKMVYSTKPGPEPVHVKAQA